MFRDGKLQEGTAKTRTQTTYSNWHSGNLNPDDLKRHRALLDRQHYRGPLWDGIKPKSVMDDPNVLLYKPDLDRIKKDKESTNNTEENYEEGVKEWEEIIR